MVREGCGGDSQGPFQEGDSTAGWMEQCRRSGRSMRVEAVVRSRWLLRVPLALRGLWPSSSEQEGQAPVTTPVARPEPLLKSVASGPRKIPLFVSVNQAKDGNV